MQMNVNEDFKTVKERNNMNKFGYIYKTTNLINNKIYIGQHKRNYFDERYKGSGKEIMKALKKYGRENFKVEIIEWCYNLQDLNDAENTYVDYYKKLYGRQCYNIAEGGNGYVSKYLSDEGKEELRKKVSNTLKGRVITELHRQRISKGLKGYKKSKEHIEKIAAKHRGLKWSDESRKNLSKARKGTLPACSTLKPVEQLSLDGNLLNCFHSINTASKETGIYCTSISKCCNNKRKTAGGYIWRFKK